MEGIALYYENNNNFIIMIITIPISNKLLCESQGGRRWTQASLADDTPDLACGLSPLEILVKKKPNARDFNRCLTCFGISYGREWIVWTQTPLCREDPLIKHDSDKIILCQGSGVQSTRIKALLHVIRYYNNENDYCKTKWQRIN